MKVYVVVQTIDYQGAIALGAYSAKDKAEETLKKYMDDDIAEGYEVIDEGGDDDEWNAHTYYALDKGAEDALLRTYYLFEMDLE